MISVDKCIEEIKKYIVSNDSRPIVVDVKNGDTLDKIKEYFNIGDNKFIYASELAYEDEIPMDSTVQHSIMQGGTIFLVGYTAFLKLLGLDELQYIINTMLNSYTKGHTVILTYQCESYLNFRDIRLRDRIYIVDGVEDNTPIINFVSNDIYKFIKDGVRIDGIHKLGQFIENTNSENIYINTKKTVQSFPSCIKYSIYNMNKAYDIIAKKYGICNKLSEDMGTHTQWLYLLEKLNELDSFDKVISLEFENAINIEAMISNYNTFTLNKRWLFFIALKIDSLKNNEYLDMVSKNINTYDEFVSSVLSSILDIEHTDTRFKNLYKERKNILEKINNYTNSLAEINEYCKKIKIKEKDSVYYLTDTTIQEKHLILKILDEYSFTQQEVYSILKEIYPELAIYLGDTYKFDNEILDKYFRQYKYQKVTNKILDEFKNIVHEQAEKREYNLWLEARDSIISKIDKEDTMLYFIDALGVEYLSYILDKCTKLNLDANISVCRCEIPTITSINKGFIEEFANNYKSIKELDEIKHSKNLAYDYTKSKVPTHLINELDTIKNIISLINEELYNSGYKKIVIVSDHGASRLAVINETDTIWAMKNRGMHSGRCCLIDEYDIDEKPKCSIEENGYLVLANYDRFKGSRKANVEVHGGATLEEVSIPIIEITRARHIDDIKIHLMNEKIIVSFRKKAVVKFYCNKKLGEITAKLGDNYYNIEEIEENIFALNTEITKAGKYTIDIYINNRLEKSLNIITESEALKEKDLF